MLNDRIDDHLQNADPANMAEDQSFDLPADMFSITGPVEETTLQMERKHFGLVNVDVKFTDLDGTAVYEGDIILGPTDQVLGIDDPGALGIGVPQQWRWPTHTIPYKVQSAVQARVEAAIAHWEQRTPFRFVPRTDEADFISFEQGIGCMSAVGRRGGKQNIILGPGCSVGSTIHEIGHALGLWHEQSRSDRDDFIEIVWENILPLQRHNFNKHILDGEDLGEYDYKSIMHYPAIAFAIDTTQPTIKAKDGAAIGQREGLSTGDIAAIKLMYPHLNWPDSNPGEDSAPVDGG